MSTSTTTGVVLDPIYGKTLGIIIGVLLLLCVCCCLVACVVGVVRSLRKKRDVRRERRERFSTSDQRTVARVEYLNNARAAPKLRSNYGTNTRRKEETGKSLLERSGSGSGSGSSSAFRPYGKHNV